MNATIAITNFRKFNLIQLSEHFNAFVIKLCLKKSIT